jgi:hypothetical protein
MATKANLTIDQGSSFSTSIALTDNDGVALNLTGYTGAAQLRKHYTSSTAVTFTVTIDALNGEVGLSLTSTQTAAIAAGRYVYDVELTIGSLVSRVIEGIVTVTPEVTKI